MNEKKLVSHKNRGMLFEMLINKTIDFYIRNKKAFFAKNHLNIILKSYSKNNEKPNFKSTIVKSKSTVDYYGIFNGKYITFEAKSTDKELFYFTNIQKHQHEHLKMIYDLGGIAFYLIFFKNYSKIFLLSVDLLDFENSNSLSIDEMKNIAIELEVIYPGIIDFLAYFEYIKK